MPVSQYSSLRYRDRQSMRSLAARLLWNLTWALLFRPSPRFGFAGWRCFLLKCFGATIGDGCKIDPSCKIWAPWNLTIGDFVAFGAGVDCYCVAPIVIGNKVAVSQRSFLCTASHDISSLQRPLISRPIAVHDHAWVCAEVFVGPGVTIGEGAIVGARSVVFRDVMPWVVVGGNPAAKVRDRIITNAKHGLDQHSAEAAMEAEFQA